MEIVFRVDASTKIGFGHLVRCATLGRALLKKGAAVQFILREIEGQVVEALSKDGAKITFLPKANKKKFYPALPSSWLGVSHDEDAKTTLEMMGRKSCDILIIDHYGIDYHWELQLLPHVRKIMVIDDLANRPHVCDVLLDQTYIEAAELRYAKLVPETCKLLMGPKYALLKPEYAYFRSRIKRATEFPMRLLVYFGGGGGADIVEKVVKAIDFERIKHLKVDLILPNDNLSSSTFRKKFERIENIRLLDPRPHIADLMATADLALGAGGTTTWERICMGIPTIVVSVAENQINLCKLLSTKNIVDYLGHRDDVDMLTIRAAICRAVDEYRLRVRLADDNRKIVDGMGTSRVCNLLTSMMSNS